MQSEYDLPVNEILPEVNGDHHGRPQRDLAPLRPVANRCSSGNCPTVYLSRSGTLVVQGYAVSADRVGVDLPEGETLVEIPLDLLSDAFRHLNAPD
jgi:hypothetical protein